MGLFVAAEVLAFNTSNVIWVAGETEFKTRFANTPQPAAKFKAGFEEALQIWTQDSTFLFTADGSQSADPCAAGSENGLRFDDDDCGRGFGSSTLAVQRAFFTGGVRSRSVITFNSAINWDVYSGPLQSGVSDLRRVAVHELGHTIGLGHEDGQPAIMQSVISNIERPTADDQAGVAAMYDLDADNIGLAEDNCPQVSNAEQADLDSDGMGDACDADIDADGVFNATTVDQSFAADQLINSLFSFGAEGSAVGWAQTFRIGVDGELVGLDLPISCNERQGGGPSSLQITIEQVSNDVPNGQIVDSINYPSGPPASEAGFIRVDLSADNNTQSVNANDLLAFTLSSNGICFWQRGSGGYPNGVAAFSNNGSSWFVQSDRDIPFQNRVTPSVLDNCPFHHNPNQADSNNNGVGNVCEDPDNDMVVNADDNCPNTPNPDQANFDGDGLGDACDSDADNDGVEAVNDSDDFNQFVCSDIDADQCDDCSLGSFNVNNDGPDTDRDGQCNISDPDDDGDGVPDNTPDNCPRTPNPDQADADGNGIGDACESFCITIMTRLRKVINACL